MYTHQQTNSRTRQVKGGKQTTIMFYSTLGAVVQEGYFFT